MRIVPITSVARSGRYLCVGGGSEEVKVSKSLWLAER